MGNPDPTNVNSTITSNIAPNGRGLITATVLSSVLLAITAWVCSGFVPHVSNLAALKASSHLYFTAVHRDGYSAPGDGGAADYIWSSTACSLNSGAGDNGSQVQASSSGCWIVAPGSGGVDARVWGAADIGLGNVTGSDSAAALTSALAWCGTQAQGVILVSGRIAANSENLTVPHGCTLQFQPHAGFLASSGQNTIAQTNSAILLGSAYTIYNSGVIDSPAIFPYGLAPATSYQDAYTKVHSFAGTAITANAPDMKVFNAFISGFATCISDAGGGPDGNGWERPWIIVAELDCTNGIAIANVPDVGHIAHVHGISLFTMGLDFALYGRWTENVSAVANNGSGLIRLTVGNTANFATGMKLRMDGIPGFYGANGNWVVTVVDGTHLDLQGSSYLGVTTTGTWASGETAITVPSMAGIWYGMAVSGTNIANGSTIRTMDPVNNKIWLSLPTTGAGSGTSLAITNGAYSSGGTVTLNNALRSGIFLSITGANGFEQRITDAFEYGWHQGAYLNNSTWVILDQFSCDQDRDETLKCVQFDGSTGMSEWLGGTAGGGAIAFVDTTSLQYDSNRVNNVFVRNGIDADPEWAEVILSGNGSIDLNLSSPGVGAVTSDILRYQGAGQGVTTLAGNMQGLDLHVQNQAAENSILFGRATAFVSTSPYVFNSNVAWAPVLTFAGTNAGMTSATYGMSDIHYPWIDARFTISVTAKGSSTGAATITGLPVTCIGDNLGLSAEGGPAAFTSGMASLSGQVTAMARAGSTFIDLYHSGATGSVQLTDANFTNSSVVNGHASCRIAYAQR